ncbi:type III secretion system effector protein [Hydrogenophaga soli]
MSTAATSLADLLGRSGRTTLTSAGDIETGSLHSTGSPQTSLESVQQASGPQRPAAAVMERLQAAIEAAVNRTIDAASAATLVNELRRAAPGKVINRPTTNADLMKGVTDEKVAAWYAAQGMNEADVQALRSAAFRSGLPYPTGSFVNNAILFIASPFLGAEKGPWAAAGLSMAGAAVGAPMNAFQQTAVVKLCESIREHGGPVIVPDKANINAKHRLPDLAKKLENDVKELASAHDAVHLTMNEIGITPDTHLESKLKSLEPAALQKLREQVEQLIGAETKLYSTQRDFMMTQGHHELQWQANAQQAIPRTLRAPVAGYTGLLAKITTNALVSPTVQTVASMVLTAGQHVAAAFDERNKQEYNNKLNLMYGDFFTAQGNDKLQKGQPIEASDIDATKLRGFISTPAQSLVKHVSDEIKRQVDGLETLLNGSNAPTRSAADIAKDQVALQALKNDAETLKSGKLTDLTPGGLAESLLVASDKAVLSPQLWADVKAKYTMLEFSAQTGQRVGQMFHLGVFGSAASSVVGRMTSAATGGVKNAPLHQALTVPAVSGFMAYVGATSQHTAIAVKDNRREAAADPGLMWQMKRGVEGGVEEYLSNRAATNASHGANELLAQDAIGNTLKFAKDVREALGALPTRFEVPLSTPPRPGDASTPGTKEVVINIPDSMRETKTPSTHAA